MGTASFVSTLREISVLEDQQTSHLVSDCETDLNNIINAKVKLKGKHLVLDIALLHDEHMLRSTLQLRMWQLIELMTPQRIM